ncbi:MAG: DUF2235 domain-containing protein [Hyphomicrobiaceae bacterium]
MSSIASSDSETVTLTVRKGSVLAPLILLLVTTFLFVVYALPSDDAILARHLGFMGGPPPPTTQELLARATEILSAPEAAPRSSVWHRVGEDPWVFVTEVAHPLFKAYLEQLSADFRLIVTSVASTLWTLALYALPVGIVGLTYRRRFTFWFLLSFGLLLAINISGIFPSLASGIAPMPSSGKILVFLLSQLGLMFLAFRLGRHTPSVKRLPPKLYNFLLFLILAGIGVALAVLWQADIGASPVRNAFQMGGPEPNSLWSALTSGYAGWIFKWETILVGLPLAYSLLRNSSAWTGRQPKNIVICVDGTNNTPDMIDNGFAAPTNVFKLFLMLKADSEGMFEPGRLFDASLCKRYDNRQIGLYYAGVGNKYDDDPLHQMIGMATGRGADDVLERAYLDLVRAYREGDRLFIVGFSRGAAIARLLARALYARGIPKTVWTIKLFGTHRTLWSSRQKLAPNIDVLGCFDTVGSFGVAKTIGNVNLQQINLFKDLTVPENVKQAYHMVALDEQRDSFEPTLMDPDPNRPERIVEVWFAGDHANIGGGWATDRLSDITLDFLLRRISSGYADIEALAGVDESWGAYLKAWKADKAEYWERQTSNPLVVDPDPLGQVQQSFSHLYKYRPRKMPQHAVISDTVFKRMVESLPLYAPQSLFDLNDALDNRRDVIDGQVAKLTESAVLSDADLRKIEGYKTKLRLNRFDDYWQNQILAARAGQFAPPQKALSNEPLIADERTPSASETAAAAYS